MAKEIKNPGSRSGIIHHYTKTGTPVYESTVKDIEQKKVKTTDKDKARKEKLEKLKKLARKIEEKRKTDKNATVKKGDFSIKTILCDIKKSCNEQDKEDAVLEKICKKYNCSMDMAKKYYKGMLKMNKSLKENNDFLVKGDISAEEALNIAVEEASKEVNSESEEVTTDKTTNEPLTTEAVTEEVSTVETVETIEETPKKEVKFAPGLFKPFTLGSTLEQGPTGNYLKNAKPNKMDYVKTEKNAAKEVIGNQEDDKK